MQNVISLFIKYSAFIAFIFFEILAFYLIINFNKSQEEIWANSTNIFTGNINEKVQSVEDFFKLQKRNDSLLIENAKLLETIINYRVSSAENNFQAYEDLDTTLKYEVIPSKICSKTLHLRNNFITLCKGETHGIKVGMGVITNDGIVGIVKNVSKDYSSVLLILNSESRTSVKINSKDYTGNLVWKDSDVQTMDLLNIPKHAQVAIGDSVSTSGFSISYPADIYIGKISDVARKGGGNSFNIKVKLNSDISKLDYVYVVSFKVAEEKSQLLDSNE